jgi:hypothetical protein
VLLSRNAGLCNTGVDFWAGRTSPLDTTGADTASCIAGCLPICILTAGWFVEDRVGKCWTKDAQNGS